MVSKPLWKQCHSVHWSFSCKSCPRDLKPQCQTCPVVEQGLRKWSDQIVYHPGRENSNADALSCNPQDASDQNEVQIVQVGSYEVPADTADITAILTTDMEISDLLSSQHTLLDSTKSVSDKTFELTQREDPDLRDLIQFLTDNTLPPDPTQAKKIVAQAPLFAIVDGILYFSTITVRDVWSPSSLCNRGKSQWPYGWAFLRR